MMAFGLAALLFAGLAAGWLMLRMARGDAVGEGRSMTILKLVIWLGLAAGLFAAKLWPLAFMVLFAAAAVTAIEAWRADKIGADAADTPAPDKSPARAMTVEEAVAVLGVDAAATAEEVRAAHKNLIGQLHPDRGGSDYLAAQINAARDFLLRRLGEN